MLAPWIDTKHIQICSPELSLNALLNGIEQLMKNYQLMEDGYFNWSCKEKMVPELQ